ncbi:hypothetical protein OV203_34290 [Nannocystis sp. ILAH1]|uniref:hypothetical protein n=1 Tax=Nannocystis sp. ILAH1 TaxID=2996789 RepID=UPI002271196C|nr:hypothetical protein [Nannocystis sp. ILAH1]MCY0992258.1 hypothetical protein [Nannocystis sp. ILAH1]
MPGRRIEAWMLLGLLLGGCDPAKERELAAMREVLAATAALVKEQGQRIESLTAELAKARADRVLCEVSRSPPLEAGGAPPAPPTDAAPEAAPAGEATLTPTCADGTCVVKRSEIDALMAAPEHMARLVRLMPVTEDGKAVGFKLFAIRSQSPLALLGFKNGDLVRTVAGQEVGDMEALLRAYSQLRTLDRWTVAGTRKASPFEVTIVVQ